MTADTPRTDSPKTRSRLLERASLAAIIIIVAVVVAFAPRNVAFLNGLEEWTRDLRVAVLTPDEPQSKDIVIISLNDATLDLQPYRIPVDRKFLADLITTLDGAGVRAISMDIFFDRTTEPEKDEAFKQAVANAHAPIIFAWAGEVLGTVGTRMAIQREFVGNHPHGHAILLRDAFDGAVRFQSPIMFPDDQFAPLSFTAAIAKAVGVEPPADRRIRIAWRGQPGDGNEPFPSFPAQIVSKLPPDWFKGKIAMIGYDLVDIDRHPTPFNVAGIGRQMAGNIAHAHALAQLLDGRRADEPGVIFDFILGLIVAASGCALAMWRKPFWVKLTTGVVVFVAIWAGSFGLFNAGGPFVPVVMPTLGFLMSAGMATAYIGRREREQRAMIRRAFARYVPPGVVARLDRDPSKLELGGERREVTMIFTDIAGFTTTAEKLDPHVLVEFMNSYLDGLGNAVLQHGGTIDKFLGDGSMSFFGAPEALDDDADRAVECALAIDAYARQNAKEWEAKGLPVGITRVGVHTGYAIVGNFGGRQRFDYTALGDTVNTASRLEGANKMFGTRVLISGDTLAKLKRGHARPVGDVVVKGREQALPLYEAVTAAEWNSPWMKRYLECFEAMKNGGDALKGFEAYVAHNPNDALGKYHLARLKNGERGVRIVLVEK